MSSDDLKRLSAISAELRQAGNALLNLADGVDIAARALSQPGKSDKPASRGVSALRNSVQRLVLESMKSLQQPVTVDDLIRLARKHGTDPKRDSVRKILQRLVQRGLAAQRGPRFQLVPDAGATDEIMAELEELLPPDLSPDSDATRERG